MSEALTSPLHGRYYGKYRGKVVENIDPLVLGRIIAEVPALPGSILNWAMPSVPYAGLQVGFFAIPPIGANVWIEFEEGDPGRPIWGGCFWGEGEVPLENVLPELKIFKTDFITMMLNDTPEAGGFTLECLPPAVNVPLTLTCNAEGITISCPEAVINMTEETITLTVPESLAVLSSELIELTVPESSLSLTPETVTLTVPPAEATLTAEVISMEAPEVSITGNTTVEGAAEITGNTNVGGALEVEGDANVLGAVEIEGNANVLGALEIEGETNVLGALTVEGEGNFAGALTVEGDEAVLGVIEGVIVPPI